ncbi:tRNA (guanine-N(1)-)-methyltransferase [Necator americanus]|uniref:tRNA (Guanine-N(1)-)-methyltransferase n=1 Tax=Necator americanus TaxID=51031 RepID=W2SI65_NECAM|nr:tRNA (guanine-N(1)-)-methyltransferase [Necator americanus]ETN68581.1 tRNA (guanine-N(1)-)-methyltransferase [Necator americanus]
MAGKSQWGEPLLTTFPSATLDARLNSDRARKLRSIVYEVKTISMLTRHFPSKILDDDWLVLLDCQTRKQRLDYLKFLRNREREREKDMEKKRLKEISSSLFVQETKCEHSSPLYYPTAKLAKEQRRQLWQRVANAYRCGAPTLVIDCRFLPLLSPRGAELTSIQLKYLISENRDSSAPWQLYFANFDLSNDKVRRLKRRHLSVIDSSSACSPVVLTIDYTHMFGRERIVYLSPDAEEELEDVDDENVYVLGGIVDRVVERGISRQASLEAATSDRVCCKRLPLDKYVKWKSGNKFLTLTAVSSILRDVNNSGGDWESALRRNIPVRNIRSAEEKCAAGRQLHEKIRHFDNQLLQILDREIGQEPL